MIDLEEKKYSFKDLYEAGVISTAIILHFERAKMFKDLRFQKFKYVESLEKTAKKFRVSKRTIEHSVKYVKNASVILSS